MPTLKELREKQAAAQVASAAEDKTEHLLATETFSASQPEAIPPTGLEELRRGLDLVLNSMESKELVGQATRYVLELIQRQPELPLQPEDIGILVRGLRQSYQGQIYEKRAKQSKKASVAALAAEFDGIF